MAKITKACILAYPTRPRVPLLTGDQQRTVLTLLAKTLGGAAPLPDVATALGLDERTAETSLRFSGFLVNNGRVK